MNKDYEFSCGYCKHIWKSSDYPDNTSIGETESKGWENAREGYNCPECNSEDISGRWIE